MNSTRVTLTEKDLFRLLQVLEWIVTDYNDKKEVEELNKIHEKLTKALDRT